MAIQVSGTEVISNARALNNIASADATTVATLNAAGVGGGFKPVSVSGTTQALNVGTYNFFNAGELSANTTISFTSVPTDALWTYTAKSGVGTGYVLGSPVYTGNEFSISGYNFPTGIHFSSDGTKLFVYSNANFRTYQFTLSTAYNVSTASYSGLSFYSYAQDQSVMDMTFSADGTKMYLVGTQNYNIYQYTLSTAWNISTASYSGLSYYTPGNDNAMRGIRFKPDGTKMYLIGDQINSIYQYSLSTAWNVSTASSAGLSKSVSNEDVSPQAFVISPDGTKLIVFGYSTKKMYQYTLSTAWNISTASYDSIFYFISASTGVLDNSVYGLAFDSIGSQITTLGNQGQKVQTYSIGLPTTLTTPAAVQNPPTAAVAIGDQASYTFVTNDGGTTVKLIGEEIT